MPLGLCRETVPGVSGVFVREFEHANVSMDCGKWEGRINGKRPGGGNASARGLARGGYGGLGTRLPAAGAR